MPKDEPTKRQHAKIELVAGSTSAASGLRIVETGENIMCSRIEIVLQPGNRHVVIAHLLDVDIDILSARHEAKGRAQ